MSSPRVAVVGLGAIGGSVALALLARGVEPGGFASSLTDATLAAKAGVRVGDTLEHAVAGADLVLLATPLDVLPAVALAAVAAAPSATVLHAGSLQRPEALGIAPEILSRVIGTHPMAGSHLSGFGAAHADMFRTATVYVERRGTPRQRADAELLWGMAGAGRIDLVEADLHDSAMAWLSHAPQLVATALASAIAGSPVPEWGGGAGLRDTTRLAASDFGVWRPILERSPASTRQALSSVADTLAELRDALEAKDWSRMERVWRSAGEWRRALEGQA